MKKTSNLRGWNVSTPKCSMNERPLRSDHIVFAPKCQAVVHFLGKNCRYVPRGRIGVVTGNPGHHITRTSVFGFDNPVVYHRDKYTANNSVVSAMMLEVEGKVLADWGKNKEEVGRLRRLRRF